MSASPNASLPEFTCFPVGECEPCPADLVRDARPYKQSSPILTVARTIIDKLLHVRM